jgi:hypothetical protein
MVQGSGMKRVSGTATHCDELFPPVLRFSLIFVAAVNSAKGLDASSSCRARPVAAVIMRVPFAFRMVAKSGSPASSRRTGHEAAPRRRRC